jgi:YfiH family protein
MVDIVAAGWDAPDHVRACTTLRGGGVSRGPYEALNLAMHVADDPRAVEENRRRLRAALALPAEPLWLRQVHGTDIVDAAAMRPGAIADGSVATGPGAVCAVLTADCLPLFLCRRDGRQVGVFHLGWRGLAAGMVEAAVASFETPAKSLLAWLGPAIGPGAFEVGAEVRQALSGPGTDGFFEPSLRRGRYLADLYQLTLRRLRATGVNDCSYDPSLCTFSQPVSFYSYRRQSVCGRMASLIWMQAA